MIILILIPLGVGNAAQAVSEWLLAVLAGSVLGTFLWALINFILGED